MKNTKNKRYEEMTKEEQAQFLKDKQKEFGRPILKEEKRKETSGAYYLDGDPFTTAYK